MTTAVQESRREPVENDETEYMGKRVPVEDEDLSEDLSDMMENLSVGNRKQKMNKINKVDDISKELGNLSITHKKGIAVPPDGGGTRKILKPLTDVGYNSEDDADVHDESSDDEVVVRGDQVKNSREGLTSMGLGNLQHPYSTIDQTALRQPAQGVVKKKGRKPGSQTVSIKHGSGGTCRQPQTKAKTVAELLKEKREREEFMKKLMQNGQIELGPYNTQLQQQTPACQQQVQMEVDAFLAQLCSDQTESLPSFDLDELQANMPELMNLLVNEQPMEQMEIANQYTIKVPTQNQMDQPQTILPNQNNIGLMRNPKIQQYNGSMQPRARPNSGSSQSSDEGYSALSPESGYQTSGTSPPHSPEDITPSAQTNDDWDIIMEVISEKEPQKGITAEVAQERAFIQRYQLQSNPTNASQISPPSMQFSTGSLLPPNTQCDPTLQQYLQAGIREPPQAEFTACRVPVNEASITAPQNVSMSASPPLPASQLIPSSSPMPTSSPMVVPGQNFAACSLQSQVPQITQASRSSTSNAQLGMCAQARSPMGQLTQANSPQYASSPQAPSPQSQIADAHSPLMQNAPSPQAPSPMGQAYSPPMHQAPSTPMRITPSPQVPSPQGQIAQAHSPSMHYAPSTQVPSPQSQIAQAHTPPMDYAPSPEARSPQSRIIYNQAQSPQMLSQNIPAVEENIPSLIPTTCQMASIQQTRALNQAQTMQQQNRPQAPIPQVRHPVTPVRRILPKNPPGMPNAVQPTGRINSQEAPTIAIIPGVVLDQQATIPQPGK